MSDLENNRYVNVNRKHLTRAQHLPVDAILNQFPLFLSLEDEDQEHLKNKAFEKYAHYPVRRQGVNDEMAGQVSYLIGHRDGIEIGLEMFDLYSKRVLLQKTSLVLGALSGATTGLSTGLLLYLRSNKTKKKLLFMLREVAEAIDAGNEDMFPALDLVGSYLKDVPRRSVKTPFGWSPAEVKFINATMHRLSLLKP